MDMSLDGIAKLRSREAAKERAYQDSVGVWTIGVGHTAAAGPPRPVRGMIISEKQIDEILRHDLVQYEDAVERAIKKPMKQREFDAMVSLCFNIGAARFAKSTLVRKFNEDDKIGAANAFRLWNRAKGKVIQGLVNRRESEREQFLGH